MTTDYKKIVKVLCLTVYIIGIVVVIYSSNQIISNPDDKLYHILFPLLLPLIITLSSPLYRFIYESPNLKLILEEYRGFLIQAFDIKLPLGENITKENGDENLPKARYIRIVLKNEGHLTAKNCSIKMYLYYSDHTLVREPSNLYPAGYQDLKDQGQEPKLIDIAAGDFQIFDICSVSNSTFKTEIVRFEDHFTYSRLDGLKRELFLKDKAYYYIDLFAYSDNNSPVNKSFKIFADVPKENSELLWKRINIIEYEEKKKKFSIDILKRKIQNNKTKSDKENNNFKEQSQEIKEQSSFAVQNKSSLPDNTNSQYHYSTGLRTMDEDNKTSKKQHDYSTGSVDKK